MEELGALALALVSLRGPCNGTFCCPIYYYCDFVRSRWFVVVRDSPPIVIFGREHSFAQPRMRIKARTAHTDCAVLRPNRASHIAQDPEP